jgi:drug/metabolite transporter (DMT)-like permease
MQTFLDRFCKRTWAKMAGVFSGIVFGIYWIPLRFMDEAGIHGMWAVMVFNVTAFALISPWVIYKWREFIPGRLRLQLGSVVTGLAYVLYTGAFLYTEVIRVLVLFYLMPIWGFILARIFIGEKITLTRWISMIFGLTGLVVICGIENGIPVPSNIGDWMALSAGILWAGISISILTDKQEPLNYSAMFLFWGGIWSIVVALVITDQGLLPEPRWQQLPEILVWLIPLAILVIIPGAFATLFAPSQLNPGIVGLLFMTEISIGTVTAALFAGEPFGTTEIIGVLLITCAGLAEPVQSWIAGNVAESHR